MSPDRRHHLEDLSAYLDGELELAARAALEEHLAGCAPCAATLEDLRLLAGAGGEEPPPVPDGLAERIAGRLAALPLRADGGSTGVVPRRRRPRVFGGPVITLAASLATAGVLWLTWQQTGIPPAQGPEHFKEDAIVPVPDSPLRTEIAQEQAPGLASADSVREEDAAGRKTAKNEAQPRTLAAPHEPFQQRDALEAEAGRVAAALTLSSGEAGSLRKSLEGAGTLTLKEPDRSIRLQEDGRLEVWVGEYRCRVEAPAAPGGAVASGPRRRVAEIFLMAQPLQPPEGGEEAPPVSRSLAAISGDGESAALGTEVRGPLLDLVREHYLQALEQACGPPPPELLDPGS